MASDGADGPGERRGLARHVEQLAVWWALAGGGVLLALVALNVVSVTTAALGGAPFPGDVELQEMGVAVAVFAFLPYGQLAGANVSTDVFTKRFGPRARALLQLLAAGVALGVATLLTWRMAFGLESYRRYAETTTILAIPHWLAFVPILLSLLLLAAASMVTVAEAIRATARR